MMAAADTPFFDAIQSLRTQGELVFSLKALHTAPAEDQMVTDFLEAEYANEVLEYPYTPPAFDSKAALWAARILYYAAQLFVYRDDPPKNLAALFATYEKCDSAAALSADLCLRYLPILLNAYFVQEASDPLLPQLQAILNAFPYSSIGAGEDFGNTFPETAWPDACYRQLYTDRILARRDAHRLQHPLVLEAVEAALGSHAESYWPGFKMLLPAAS